MVSRYAPHEIPLSSNKSTIDETFLVRTDQLCVKDMALIIPWDINGTIDVQAEIVSTN
jgi:hypothetical protein